MEILFIVGLIALSCGVFLMFFQLVLTLVIHASKLKRIWTNDKASYAISIYDAPVVNKVAIPKKIPDFIKSTHILYRKECVWENLSRMGAFVCLWFGCFSLSVYYGCVYHISWQTIIVGFVVAATICYGIYVLVARIAYCIAISRYSKLYTDIKGKC